MQRKQIDSAALERMKRYSWPGNVRELENMVRRLAALYPQDTITEALIETELSVAVPPAISSEPVKAVLTEETLSEAVDRHLTAYFAEFKGDLPPPGLYHRILRDIEEPLIGAALAATRGNQIRAAELLGLNRNTLRKKIRDLDVRVVRNPR